MRWTIVAGEASVVKEAKGSPVAYDFSVAGSACVDVVSVS